MRASQPSLASWTRAAGQARASKQRPGQARRRLGHAMSGARAKAVPWSTRHEAVGRTSCGQARTVWPLVRYVPPSSLRPWSGPMPGCLAPLYLCICVSFFLQRTELDKDKMELAQVCTKVPRNCPVPQQFKGRALEKVKSRRTTKKKAWSCRLGTSTTKTTPNPRGRSSELSTSPWPTAPFALDTVLVHTAPIFSHTKPSGPLCCLCGSLPDGEAVLHEQYVCSCRARVNVGGSWTSPQCTPASNPRPRSIRFAVSTYLFPPRGGASLLSLLPLLLVLTSVHPL